MKLSLWLGGMMFGLLLFAYAMGAEPRDEGRNTGQIIPLHQIWAYKMPATRDVLKIEGRSTAKQIEEIRGALSMPPPVGKNARAGFAVAGSGDDALREAQAVLVEGKKARETFPTDSEISAVFFSYQFGPFIHLSSVERRENEIEVRYQFVPHEDEQVREHIAIIPLGRLSPGKYHVEIVNAPMADEFIAKGFSPVPKSAARRVVCDSFDFVVQGRLTNRR